MNASNLPEDLKRLVEYHTHLCLGIMIGYKACKYAVNLIGMSDNMKVVSENNSCGNDAVRFLLDCTKENGKLECINKNIQEWCFYNYDEEEGVRLSLSPMVLNQLPKDKNQAIKYLFDLPENLIFQIQPFLQI